jgi:ribonuclease P protein component
MTLYMSPSPRQQTLIGIVCSKETFRRSVDRNRVKRRLRECYRLHQGELKTGIEVVLVAKKEMRPQPPPLFEELTADFLVLCEKAELLGRQIS